jgi:hypothetical protein
LFENQPIALVRQPGRLAASQPRQVPKQVALLEFHFALQISRPLITDWLEKWLG